MMRIHSFRAGFATNSSSSHSVILLPPHEIGRVNGIDSDSTNIFGWDHFRLVSEEDKLRYLAAQLFSNYHNEAETVEIITQMMDAEIAGYADEVAAMAADKDNWQDTPTVDHQSVLTLPKRFDPELTRAMIKYFKSPRVAVLGGNDNTDEHNNVVYGAENVGLLSQIRDIGSRDFVSRHDGPFWTLFDGKTGNKVRFSFDRDDLSADAYVKSSVPELLDVKITDWCDKGCNFCVTGDTEISTPNGVSQIRDLVKGSEVLVLNFDTNAVESASICETYKREYVGDVIDIETENGSVITITPEHEVYVSEKGWITAGEIEDGDDVIDIREYVDA